MPRWVIICGKTIRPVPYTGPDINNGGPDGIGLGKGAVRVARCTVSGRIVTRFCYINGGADRHDSVKIKIGRIGAALFINIERDCPTRCDTIWHRQQYFWDGRND